MAGQGEDRSMSQGSRWRVARLRALVDLLELWWVLLFRNSRVWLIFRKSITCRKIVFWEKVSISSKRTSHFRRLKFWQIIWGWRSRSLKLRNPRDITTLLIQMSICLKRNLSQERLKLQMMTKLKILNISNLRTNKTNRRKLHRPNS